MASNCPPKKNVAFTMYYFIMKNDGTIIANPTLTGSNVHVDGNVTEVTNSTLAVVDSTTGLCSIVLAQATMNGDQIDGTITSSSTGAIVKTFKILTAANTQDEIVAGTVHAKVDVDTIKTQAVTCAAGVTVAPYVGNATAALAADANGRVQLQTGTGAGQLDFTSGVVKASMVQILGAAITGTAANIVGAFTKFFDKTSPTGTVNSLPDAVAGAASGLAIVGSNMGTTTTSVPTVGQIQTQLESAGSALASLLADFAALATTADVQAQMEGTGSFLALIKAVTDLFRFTKTNQVDANTLSVGGTTQTARDLGQGIPNAVAGATGGLAIVGSKVDLIDAPNATAVSAFVTAINNLATYGLTALNTLLVTTGIKAASVPNVTLASTQGSYAPAKAGDKMDLIDAPNATALAAMVAAFDLASAEDIQTQMEGSGSYLALIKAVTDLFRFTVAHQVDANALTGGGGGSVTVAGYAAGEDPATLLLATPANKIATDASGKVTVGTNSDKSGYALSSTGVTAVQSGLSTYAGGDTAGTTTLLSRLTALRAGYLDLLNTYLDAAVSSRSTYAGGDTAGVTTLLSRITGAVALAATALTNATWTDAKAAFLNASVAAIPTNPYTGTPPTVGQIQTQMESAGSALATLLADWADAASTADIQTQMEGAGSFLALIKTVTDLLNGMLENSSGERFTTHALMESPTGGAAPSVAQIAAGILATPAHLLATDASGNVAANNMVAAAPTAAAVRTEMDSNSTKLAHLQADYTSTEKTAIDLITGTPNTTTPPTAASVAALILATPANKLATDANGKVTAANVTPVTDLSPVTEAIEALNDFDPATDAVEHVVLVDTTTVLTDAPDMSGIATEANATANKNTIVTAIQTAATVIEGDTLFTQASEDMGGHVIGITTPGAAIRAYAIADTGLTTPLREAIASATGHWAIYLTPGADYILGFTKDGYFYAADGDSVLTVEVSA